MGGPFGPKPGRPPGFSNKLTQEARDFAKGILDSEEYRASLMRRIKADSLAPAVECLLYYYRYGKPKETISVTEKASSADVPKEVMQERALILANLIAKHVAERTSERANDEVAQPFPPSNGNGNGGDPSVH